MPYVTTTINEFGLTGTSPVDFTMKCDNALIYAGRGWAKPNQASVYVRPNEIFSQYLGQVFPALIDGQSTDADLVRAFQIISGTTKNYTFCYGREADVDNTPHHAPITGRLAKGQYFIASVFKAGTSVVTSAGTTVLSAVNKNRVISTAALTGGIRVEVGTGKAAWTIVPKCHRYLLYYVNDFGAWDSLVMEGNYRQTDTYARSETGVYPQAGVSEEVAQTSKVYLNEITRGMTLNTGFLTDAEAARMHHLLGSVKVYLCDMNDGNAHYPVKITNADCPYKTYKNEGGQMVNYELTVELETTITRR